ncbi:MAG: MiaB/RimO family radical SAM methylthiotransferase [Desulfovibrio sp.]|nr:MiaB/RimO family radical SAM methylthiotransferase [Desulfovibrio sp.]
MKSGTFFIDTYGCKINQSESQAIREGWLRAGFRETENPGDAEYIIINSCAVTSKAERDARNALYRHKREAPDAKIILSGCASRLFKNFVPRKDGNWTRPDIFGTNRDLVSPPGPINSASPVSELFAPLSTYKRGRPVIKIQDGCSQGCAYCIIPFLRGKPVSRHPEEILAECRRLLAAGFGELVISGINLALYRSPDGGNYWRLLAWLDEELSREFAGQARLRTSSIDPSQLTDEALEVLERGKMLCPHLHLSLQHASPWILKSMRRPGYDIASVAGRLGRVRTFWPRMGLGADLIAGFPGESERDVEILLDSIPSLGLTYAHIFPYSARPGTRAASMSQQVPLAEKKRRAELARRAVDNEKNKFLASMIGRQCVVAPDAGNDEGGATRGVNEYYIQCEIAGDRTFPPMGLARALAIATSPRGLIVEPGL